MATGTPSDVKTAEGDVSIDLPAPAGWKKKFTPKKGATPGRNEVVFIAPDGEEIKSKTQLRGYLKSHPAGVTFKEFDWSTGDTPRRSSRLSGKTKASESPENETPEKRQRKSSSKKATKEKGEGSEDEAASEGGKEAPEASNADAEDTVEHGDKDVVSEKDAAEDPVKGGDVEEAAAEEEKAAGEGQEAAAEGQEAAAEEHEAAAEEHEAAAEEQETDAMVLEAAGEEHKSDVKEKEADAVKEQEAGAGAGAGGEEEKSEQDAIAVEEQEKKSEDVKEEQVGGADEEKAADVAIEEAVDMDALLGSDDNEATDDGVNEDVQLEIGDGVTDKKKEGDQVSDSSKQQSNGEEKGSVPSQVSEEDKQAEAEFWAAEEWPVSEEQGGPSDFLASLPADFLEDALAAGPAELGGDQSKYASSDPAAAAAAAKAEATADPVPVGGGAHKSSSSKDEEAGNQKSVAAGDDAVMQEANIEDKHKEDL